MITFLYGGYGSGKTTEVLRLIKKSTDEARHTFLIVPDQEAVLAERLTLEALPSSAQLHLEVLSFSRLYNRVCREYGGLSYRYVKKSVRHLLMWQNLRELSPLLEEFDTSAATDGSLCDMMLSAVGEFKASGISPEELEHTASKLQNDDPLYRKLRDLALIYASFDRLVAERYTDAADDLSRLADLLAKHDFFRGCDIFIDSFTSFTAAEHRVIARMLATANNVTVTIPLPLPDACEIYTQSMRDSVERLKKCLPSGAYFEERVLHGNRRATTPSLAHLSQNLWRLDVSDKENEAEADGSIVMEICQNPYEEAEAVAAHILELLRRGERCRDMAVIVRDPEQYRGILEPAMKKNGIPFFLSERTDLCTLAPVKLILSALRIHRYHWRKNDILDYVKTGLCTSSMRAVDLFEEYVNTWNIQGDRFLGDDWSMNPDGYSEILTNRGRDILANANEVRRALTEPLLRLFVLLDAAENVPDMCRALYAFLEEIQLSNKLEVLASREAARGEKKNAQTFSSLYGVILQALADVAEALEDETADVEELYTILKTMFRETDIGTIPTSIDEVTVGSAATLRIHAPKYAFVLGLCEGEFPASVSDRGILAEQERQTLLSLGMELSTNRDTRASDELMFVLRAFCAPSHGLYLFTNEAEVGGKTKLPSLPFTRVKKLFPNITPHRFDGADLRYLAQAPHSAVAHLRALTDTPEGEALRLSIEPFLPAVSHDIREQSHNAKAQLSPSTADRVMGDHLSLSFSRFETFVKCPFSYYCTYVLKLRETGRAKFRFSDMGSFVHYILEQLLRFAITEDENGNLPDATALTAKTEEIVSTYVRGILPTDEKPSARLCHLCDRLTSLSLLMVNNLVEEFAHSRFRPAFFEWKMDGKNGNPPPLMLISDDEQYRVSFTGVIDRVDLLKKDGEVYIRIVDYKTGTKDFRLDDLRHGMNTQMLLYLYALCFTRDEAFAEKIGLAPEHSPKPAGVVYLSANIPTIETDDYTSVEEMGELAAEKLKRSGLLLDDEAILRDMNDALNPDFLAGVRPDKKGEGLTGKALTSADQFDTLFSDIRKTVLDIAGEMRNGCADASPLIYGDLDPCAYCTARTVCRTVKE